MKSRNTVPWVLAIVIGLVLAASPDAAAQSRKKKDEEEKKDTKKQHDAEGKEMTSLVRIFAEARKIAGGQWTITVRGTTEPNMVDGLELTVSLHFHLPDNPARDTKTHVAIKDNQFGKEEEILFGPYDSKAIPNGNFWVKARFVYGDQTNLEAMRAYRESFTNPKGYERFLDFSDQTSVMIGSASKEKVQDGKRRDHYQETTDWILDLLDEFDWALASALKSCYPDRVTWAEEVEKSELLRDDETREALEGKDLKKKLDELWAVTEYVKGGGLNVDAWREFLDREEKKEIASHPLKSGGWRGRVMRLYHDHQLFKDSALGGKLPKADERLDQAIANLLSLSMLWSRKLYQKNGLSKDPADVTPVDPIPLYGKGSHRRILSAVGVIRKEVNVYLPAKKKR